MLNQMFIAQNKGEKVEPLTLSVSPTSINWVNGEGGESKTITITTNGNWRVTQYSQEILSLNKTSGTGNDSIQITLKDNINATTSANVAITATLGSQTQSTNVSISLPVYTLNVTGLVGNNTALFNESEPPVQDASRKFTVNTNWPSWTMSVTSTYNLGSNWRTWISFNKEEGTSSDNQVTYTMNNSYFREGIMEVRFTGKDNQGNSQQYNYTWKITGISQIILHMKKNGSDYEAYITDKYYTSLTKLQNAREYEKHGLFYPGSYLLKSDGPIVKLYDEYNIDCSPVYRISHENEEGYYYINFTPVADQTTFYDPDLGRCGLRYIWVVNSGSEWVDASVLSRIRLNWDPNENTMSYFLRDIVPESSMDKHYYHNGYETEDTISPTGRGATGLGWFQPYISNRAYAETWDERPDIDNFTKVIAFQSIATGYTGWNLLLVSEWDGSTTSVQISSGDMLEIPDNYSGRKARWTSTSSDLTADNFEYVSKR